MSEKRVVVAIDYGTAASGYAWAFANTTHGDQGKIKNLGNVKFCADYSSSGGKDRSLIATDEQGRLIPWYNPDPEETREKHYIGTEVFQLDLDVHFIHKRVKMDLYAPPSNTLEGINVTGNAEPAKIYREIRGVKFYTLDLIAAALRELSERALHEIKMCSGVTYSPKDALWVVTIPASATQLQKDAMREAARRAGMIDSIEADNLIFTFEPEMAAIYIYSDDACRERFKQHAQDGKYITLIVDAGGGTVDITAFLCDFNRHNRLKEAGYTRASNAGSTYIDKAVLDYIAEEVFPELDLRECQRKTLGNYADFLKGLASEKEHFNPARDDEVRINVELLVEYCEDNNIPYNKDKIKRNRLFIPSETFVGFVKTQFDAAIGKIMESVRNVKTNYPGVPICYTIVGGLGCSSVYRQMVVKRLESEDANYVDLHNDNMRKSAVLHGAALYGDDPTMIDRRYCRYTFGTDGCTEYVDKLHKNRSTFTCRNQKYASGIFVPFITKGTELKDGKFSNTRKWECLTTDYNPLSGEIVKAEIHVWEIWDSEIPQFLADTENKKEIATYYFDLTCDSNGELHYFLSFTADKTEMRIQAIDCSNDKVVLDEPLRFSANIWQHGR